MKAKSSRRKKKKGSGLTLVAVVGVLCLLGLGGAVLYLLNQPSGDGEDPADSLQTAREALARGSLDQALSQATQVLGSEDSTPETKKAAQDLSVAATDLQGVRTMWQTEKRFATALGMLGQLSEKNAQQQSKPDSSESGLPDLTQLFEAENDSILAEQEKRLQELDLQIAESLTKQDWTGALVSVREATSFELGSTETQRKEKLTSTLQQVLTGLQGQSTKAASAAELSSTVNQWDGFLAFVLGTADLAADTARWTGPAEAVKKQLLVERPIFEEAEQSLASGNKGEIAKALKRGVAVQQAKAGWAQLAATLQALPDPELAVTPSPKPEAVSTPKGSATSTPKSAATPTPKSAATPTPKSAAAVAELPPESPESAVFEAPPMEALELEELAQTAFEVESLPPSSGSQHSSTPASVNEGAASEPIAAEDLIGAELDAIESETVSGDQPTEVPAAPEPPPTEVPTPEPTATEVPPPERTPTEVPVAPEPPPTDVPVAEVPPTEVSVVAQVQPTVARVPSAVREKPVSRPTARPAAETTPRNSRPTPKHTRSAARPPARSAPTSRIEFTAPQDLASVRQRKESTGVGRQYYGKGRELEKQAETRKDSTYYRIAVEAYDKVPEDAERIVYVQAQARAGRLLSYQLRDYAQAVQHFERAVRKDTRHPLLHYELGYAAFHLGRYDEAIGAFSKVGLFAGVNPEEIKDFPKLELQMFFLNALAHEAKSGRKPGDTLLLRDAISAWQSYLDSCRVSKARCDAKRQAEAEAHSSRLRETLKKSLDAKGGDGPG